MMTNALYSAATLKQCPVDFRIGAIISDGMWYTVDKWRRLSHAPEADVRAWIDEHMKDGTLVQSPTGARSYRFPLESIYDWYKSNNLDIREVQIVSSIFPARARIWDGMTEVEGFLEAPLRAIGMVTFSCSTDVSKHIISALEGVARVRETDTPGRYKAYGLHAGYMREIIETEFDRLGVTEDRRIYSRRESLRRELVDFSPSFASNMVDFYKRFARTLVRGEMETIKVFLPEEEDRESQIVEWVITAIEKFNESASVPFSGYLESVLHRWPYDLTSAHLGKELADFQRKRSRAVKTLRKQFGDDDRLFTGEEISEAMKMDTDTFNELEEKHRIWTKTRMATTITWDQNSDERSVEANLSGGFVQAQNNESDLILANKLSRATIEAARASGCYQDAFNLIGEIDVHEIDNSKLESLSEKFVSALGKELGVV